MIDRIISGLTGLGIALMKAYHFVLDGAIEFYELANIKIAHLEIGIAAIILFTVFAATFNPGLLWLIALAPVAFIQNMFFTLVSRSRNSQDTDYHRFCAWGSNGVWFICQVMIVKNIWGAINAGQWWYAILAGAVYSLATTEGSVLMMKRLIATEKGKRRVGANDKIEKLEARIVTLETKKCRCVDAPVIKTNNTLLDRVINAVSTVAVPSQKDCDCNPMYCRHGDKK